MQIMLVGNPNCGKTTLFNALTGENQRVGNWPGVTVEQKTGEFFVNKSAIQVIDLPGVYSLNSSLSDTSQDAQITTKAVTFEQCDVLINVIDACHLERHLYLTSQLLELGKPMILALNMMDLAKKRGITINSEKLSKSLKIPVVILKAHRGEGVSDLKQLLTLPMHKNTLPMDLLPNIAKPYLSALIDKLQENAYPHQTANFIARRALEGDELLMPESRKITNDIDFELEIAENRYQWIHDVVVKTLSCNTDQRDRITAKIDRVLLHKWLALPLFFSIIYLMFFIAIHIGGALQPFFELSADALFVQSTHYLLEQAQAPAWLIAVCADGIGMGIKTTLTFIPVLAAMFLCLSFLESSGYMARAAFIMDRVMRCLGLPGKAFVPMIIGFGCNVPAILATRTLENERDRIMAILMSPFMSCGARLTIYAVFVAAFFPTGGQNIVFSLYILGILMAVLTGFLLKKTLFSGVSSALFLELPPYHPPTLKRLWNDMTHRLYGFLKRSSRLIVVVCLLLGGLNAVWITPHLSILAWLGKIITPIFIPMGIDADNWPATVGLLTGTLAKEVVIGTLNQLYSTFTPIKQQLITYADLCHSFSKALMSLPWNSAGESSSAITPILYGELARAFGGQAAAYAYLLFILLYIPCVSTMAAIRQESSRKWMWYSIVWSLGLAYSMAVLFYQCATFFDHPESSIALILTIIGLFAIGWIAILRPRWSIHVITNS